MDRKPVSRLPQDGHAPCPTGPPDAAQLFAAHADRVAGWASRLGGPTLEVEDVVQEVFVIVHRRLQRFAGESSITSWLYGITANVVRQQRRRARRRRWFGLGQPPELEEPVRTPTPVEELERRRRAQAVYRVLDRMRSGPREILILSAIEGLPGDEIAALTQLKIGTVWVRIHRAREEFSRLARKLIPDEVAAIEALRSDDSASRSAR